LKSFSPDPGVPDDDNVYASPAVIRQILDDIREARKELPLTRKLLSDPRLCWRCRCGASKYKDLGDRIRCLACGAEHEVSDP
jgi:hypothetical protein